MKKTIEERTIQCVEILRKIRKIGINTEFESVKEVRKMLNNFIKTGEPYTGKFYVIEGNFYIHLVLTNKKNKDCSATLSKN